MFVLYWETSNLFSSIPFTLLLTMYMFIVSSKADHNPPKKHTIIISSCVMWICLPVGWPVLSRSCDRLTLASDLPPQPLLCPPCWSPGVWYAGASWADSAILNYYNFLQYAGRRRGWGEGGERKSRGDVRGREGCLLWALISEEEKLSA